MGLLILPFILGAFIITIISIIITTKMVIKREIKIKEFFLGLLASLTIYGIILLCYKLARSAWAFSPGFIIPGCLFGIPFCGYLITRFNTNKSLSSILLTSIIFSGILATVFYKAYFEFFDYIGIEKFY